MTTVGGRRPTTWTYNDVYAQVIEYIHTQLNQFDYSLNFGVIALSKTRPEAIIRFTLKHLPTAQFKQFEVLVIGSTLVKLYNSIKLAVETHKCELPPHVPQSPL